MAEEVAKARPMEKRHKANPPIEDCSPFTLSFANGGSQRITTKTRIPITVEDRKEDLDVFLYTVERKKRSFDMILGDTCLRLAKPVLECEKDDNRYSRV